MSTEMFSQTTPQLAALRKGLAPDIHETFTRFSERVFAASALPVKNKQLIAVAAPHVTQYRTVSAATRAPALRHGATSEEIMEAIWVAVEMRAAAAFAHAALALDVIEKSANSTTAS